MPWITRTSITAYHLASKGIVERFHRQWKSSIKAYRDPAKNGQKFCLSSFSVFATPSKLICNVHLLNLSMVLPFVYQASSWHQFLLIHWIPQLMSIAFSMLCYARSQTCTTSTSSCHNVSAKRSVYMYTRLCTQWCCSDTAPTTIHRHLSHNSASSQVFPCGHSWSQRAY